MEKHLKQKQDEFREIINEHDEVILKLLKQGHREIIVRILTDYLSQFE